MTRLTTSRLILEPVGARNAGALWRVMQSADLREFQDVPRLSREDFVRRVAARPRRFDGRTVGRFEWLIRQRASPTPIGWVSLRVGESGSGIAEIGYSLVASVRRRGFATEAVHAIVDAGFAMGLHQVDACCVPENTASRRLLQHLAFTEVRVQTHGAMVRGKPVDICIYRLTGDEWRHAAVTTNGATAGLRTRS